MIERGVTGVGVGIETGRTRTAAEKTEIGYVNIKLIANIILIRIGYNDLQVFVKFLPSGP